MCERQWKNWHIRLFLKVNCLWKKQYIMYCFSYWLWKCLPGISFTINNLSQNKIRMIKLKEELKELSDDSTEGLKCNIIEWYIDRQVCGTFACFKNVYFSDFASYHYKTVFLNMITNQIFLKKTSEIRILIFQ